MPPLGEIEQLLSLGFAIDQVLRIDGTVPTSPASQDQLGPQLRTRLTAPTLLPHAYPEASRRVLTADAEQ